MTTVPPAFPGDFSAYADQAPDLAALWERFAEDTATRQHTPQRAVRVLLAGKPWNGSGSHRKPNRRPHVITTALGILLLLAASFTIGAGLVALAAPASAAVVTVTPAREAAACGAAQDIHDRQAQHVPVPSAVWWRAYRLAGHADGDLKRAERHWLKTGRGWAHVNWLCGYGL